MTRLLKNGITMEVTSADNRLTVLLNPDGDRPTYTVYCFDAYLPSNIGANINLTDTISKVGGSGTLALIGSNFIGGGQFYIEIKTDGESALVINENLPQWTSQQWKVEITKS
ncbi:MAG: hypothetical protein F6K63_19405 [Moorea sp. SIO1G6]|uniref:hypothetical protein n=1 Tax=Moorena sp. SIO1G6 TaxID=2607840 RepID=UPI0013C21FC7|nr:hypothetical protein [Moorena sp. SIO1G6]NET66436.1 hypothetical protein [Moorena sp. SIO1G6]